MKEPTIRPVPSLTGDAVFLILEAGPEYTILPTLYELEPQPHWQYLFTDTEWAPYLSESPVVIETQRDAPFLKKALETLTHPDTLRGVVLESSRPLSAILGWARHRLTVRFGESQKGLLRFYDPLIWHALCSSTETPAPEIIMAHYWQLQGGAGQWRSITNPELAHAAAEPSLSATQVASLDALNSDHNSNSSIY